MINMYQMSGIFGIFCPFFLYNIVNMVKKKTPHTEISDNYMTFYTGIFNQIEEFIDKHSLQI